MFLTLLRGRNNQFLCHSSKYVLWPSFSCCYSVDSQQQKQDEKQEKYKQRLNKDIERIERVSKRLQAGHAVGKTKWKFYLEDFVFKNLSPDNVPPSYQMVFRSPLEMFANFSILGAGILSVYAPLYTAYISITPGAQFPFENSEMIGLGIGSLATVCMLYFICLQVPLRVYFSEEDKKFRIYMPTFIPWGTHAVEVGPGEFLPPAGQHPYFPWRQMQHIHIPTGRKMLLQEENFSLPVYYNILMGYTK